MNVDRAWRHAARVISLRSKREEQAALAARHEWPEAAAAWTRARRDFFVRGVSVAWRALRAAHFIGDFLRYTPDDE